MTIESKELERIEAEVAPIVTKAAEIAVVTSPEKETRAVEFLGQIKTRAKIVDEARTRYVGPLNAQVKLINGDFKKILGPLETAEMQVKSGITSWRQSAAFKVLEEKRIALEQEGLHAIKQNDNKTLEEIGKEHAGASAAAPTIVRSDSGSAHFRTDYKIEITDASLVPREFLVPDEKAILRTITKTKVDIAGVKWWTVETPVIRT